MPSYLGSPQVHDYLEAHFHKTGVDTNEWHLNNYGKMDTGDLHVHAHQWFQT